MKNKVHYVYKIINNKNNKEYIGVRSHSCPEKDPYMGSSNILNNLYKIEGKENFTKIILKKFTTRQEAEKYESKLLTLEYCNSPNTYNLTCPGDIKNTKHGFRKDIWFDYYDEIRKQYIQGNTLKELANKYGCDGGTISMIISDIKRTNSESQKIRHQKTFTSKSRNYDLDNHINNIINLYIKENKSILYISQLYNVDSGTIKRRLIESKIKIRTHKESQQKRTTGRNKSSAWNYEQDIINLYLQKKSLKSISKLYSCDSLVIKNILIKNNLINEKKN